MAEILWTATFMVKREDSQELGHMLDLGVFTTADRAIAAIEYYLGELTWQRQEADYYLAGFYYMSMDEVLFKLEDRWWEDAYYMQVSPVVINQTAKLSWKTGKPGGESWFEAEAVTAEGE